MKFGLDIKYYKYYIIIPYHKLFLLISQFEVNYVGSLLLILADTEFEN